MTFYGLKVPNSMKELIYLAKYINSMSNLALLSHKKSFFGLFLVIFWSFFQKRPKNDQKRAKNDNLWVKSTILDGGIK